MNVIRINGADRDNVLRFHYSESSGFGYQRTERFRGIPAFAPSETTVYITVEVLATYRNIQFPASSTFHARTSATSPVKAVSIR